MSALFFKRFLQRPLQVASIIPSSRALVERVADKVDFARARVIAAASTDEKCARLKELGADFVLNHSREDVPRRIRELTSKRGVDVVVDYIGKDTWAKSIQIARRGGRIVTCGATSGYDPAEDLRQIFFRQIEIIGCTMGNNQEFGDAMRCLINGKLAPVIDSVMPFKDVQAAHRKIEERKTFGKIVLVP